MTYRSDKISNNNIDFYIKQKKEVDFLLLLFFVLCNLKNHFFPFNALSIPSVAFFAVALLGSIAKILFQYDLESG